MKKITSWSIAIITFLTAGTIDVLHYAVHAFLHTPPSIDVNKYPRRYIQNNDRVYNNLRESTPIFFTSPTLEDEQEQKAVVFQRINERLLNAPLGTLTKEMVKEAKHCMAVRQSDPRRVELLLKRLVDEKKAGNNLVTIGTDLYNSVIQAWMLSVVRGGTSYGSRRAIEILQYMIEFSRADALNQRTKFLMPNLQSFCLALLSIDDDDDKTWFSLVELLEDTLLVGQKCDDNDENDEAQYELLSTIDFEQVFELFVKLRTERLDVLLNIMDHLNAKGYERIRPSVKCYNAALYGLANDKKSDPEQTLEQIDKILWRMEDAKECNTDSYTMVMTFLANRDVGDGDLAESILERMDQQYTNGNTEAKPDLVIYKAAIGVLCKAPGKVTTGQLMKILQKMEASSCSPDLQMYNLVLKIYASSGEHEKAEALLNDMYRAYKKKRSSVKPDHESFTIVLNAWANSTAQEIALKHANEIFQFMVCLYRDGDERVRPSGATYTALLYCLARSGASCSVVKATAILDEMEREFRIQPNTNVMNAYIHCLANAEGDVASIEKAVRAIQRMEEMHENGESGMRPDVVTYTCLITGYAKSNMADAGVKAEEILFRMESMAKAFPGLAPNVRSYNAALAAWARSRVKGAANRGQILLERMEDMYNNGNEKVKPDVYSYTTTIHAWAKSSEKGSTQRAARLLHRMEKLSETDPSLKPNMHTYTIVINAWAKSGEPDAPEKAQHLLDKMENSESAKPNISSYTSAIDCIAKSRRPNAARKADEMLSYLKEKYEKGERRIKPNTRAYNAVLNAWALSDNKIAAARCDEILEEMEDLYAAGDSDVIPNTITYSTVMCTYARSREKRKGYRCLQVLNKMKELYKAGNDHVKPNVFGYTTVINACAKTRGHNDERNEALKIAYETFVELEGSPYGEPNFITFSVFMKAAHFLLPKSDMRNRLVELIFKKACDAGEVEKSVLKQLRYSVPDDFYFKAIGKSKDKKVKIDDLPKHWTRNIRRL